LMLWLKPRRRCLRRWSLGYRQAPQDECRCHCLKGGFEMMSSGVTAAMPPQAIYF